MDRQAAGPLAEEITDIGMALLAVTLKQLPDLPPTDVRLFYLFYEDERVGPLKADNRPLAIRTAALGADHSDVALCLAELAELAEQRHRLDEAERLHRRALTIWEAKLGADHPYAGFPHASLGLIAARRGDLARAESELRRAVAILASGDALDLAWAQWGLGCVLRDRGQFEEAERLLRAALAVRTRELASGDEEIVRARDDLAVLLRAAGRPAEARSL
jgi:tetratricopeptide (TPR) repeat protein